MPKLDDLIEELRGDGRDEDAEELEKLRGSTLRKQAEKAERLERELADEKSKRERLEKGPKVRKAFEKAGVDFEGLSKLERAAIEAYDGDLEDEDIESFIEENELSVKDESEEDTESKDDEPEAAKVAKAARRSGERKGDPTKITPQMANEWSHEKRLAFLDEHPDEYEQLLQGETVTGVRVPA
jgi:hypothetical protein